MFSAEAASKTQRQALAKYQLYAKAHPLHNLTSSNNILSLRHKFEQDLRFIDLFWSISTYHPLAAVTALYAATDEEYLLNKTLYITTCRFHSSRRSCR
jgi:hypothetical protein